MTLDIMPIKIIFFLGVHRREVKTDCYAPYYYTTILMCVCKVLIM